MDSNRSPHLGRWLIVASAAVSLSGMFLLAPASAQDAVETCFGEPVTVSLADGDRPTKGDDVILGTDKGDYINAKGGHDLICGGGGDDFINGARGNDRIRGGAGNDTIMGGNGTDELYGGPGNDSLRVGQGKGSLDGGNGGDACLGTDNQSNCEPYCDLDQLATADLQPPTVTIKNGTGEYCHFGPRGLHFEKSVLRDATRTRTSRVVRVEYGEKGATKVPRLEGLDSGATLTVTFVNRQRRCADNGRVTKSIHISAGDTGKQHLTLKYEVPACGLAYVTSID